MGGKEYARSVRGSGGRPIQTTETQSIQTDNYREGDVFSGSPPGDIDPLENIQEINITKSDSDSTMTITTVSGTIVGPIQLNGLTPSINYLDADSISFGGNSEITGFWVGEQV